MDRITQLKSIWTLAKLKVFLIRNLDGGEPERFDVPDMPENLIYPLLAYLGEIPGYDMELPYNQQKSEKPSEQHGYAIFYFTSTFTQLAVSLGHIFKAETGDIDMRDVVMNRRVLIVNLPALQGSDDNLAAMGRIVIASLRAMMAQLLGAKLEGDPHELFAFKPGMGVGAFRVDFDEIGYYATSGMDRMLAMGRGINMGFRIAFQELGGIWARLGEKTYSLLGNANTTIAMRQQDSARTREWLEKTAGQSWVTQATSYQGGAFDGTSYRETQNAEMRQVSRVDWQDLQRLLPGEAVMLFGGRRIYAKLFHVPLVITGRPRLNRPLMLAVPKADVVRGPAERAARVRGRIEDGLLSEKRDAPLSGVLEAVVNAMAAAAAASATTQGCIAAALNAAGPPPIEVTDQTDPSVPAGGSTSEDDSDLGDKANVTDDAPPRQPVTTFTPMLDVTATAPPVAPGPAGRPVEPVDSRLLAELIAIEVAGGASKYAAKENALAALGERDASLAGIVFPEKPTMHPGELGERLDRLTACFAVLAVTATARTGQPQDGWPLAAE